MMKDARSKLAENLGELSDDMVLQLKEINERCAEYQELLAEKHRTLDKIVDPDLIRQAELAKTSASVDSAGTRTGTASGKQLGKSQVRLMARIQLQIEEVDLGIVTDGWLDALFDRFSKQKTSSSAQWKGTYSVHARIGSSQPDATHHILITGQSTPQRHSLSERLLVVSVDSDSSGKIDDKEWDDLSGILKGEAAKIGTPDAADALAVEAAGDADDRVSQVSPPQPDLQGCRCNQCTQAARHQQHTARALVSAAVIRCNV